MNGENQKPFCLANCLDKLRKLTLGMAEGWLLAASPMGVQDLGMKESKLS